MAKARSVAVVAGAVSHTGAKRGGRTLEIASPRVLHHLDIIRGVAALTVVIGHVRGLFFANWVSLPSHNPALMLLYFLTSLGRQAVIVFFVLSGFFIGWAVIGGIRGGRWSWRGYLVRRLTRLGIVLVPALLLTAFWDLAGIGLFGAQSAYLGGRPGDSILTFRVVDSLTPSAFLGNLLFLQGIHGIPWFGSNAPLWSLSYEFWYYILFPLMLSAYVARGWIRWTLCGVAILILFMIGPTIASYYLVWLLGVIIVILALWLGPRRETLPGWILIPVSMILGLGLLVGQRHLTPVPDAILGCAFAIFMAGIVLQGGSSEFTSGFGRLYAYVAHRVAGCSYTIYLVHLPLLIFLRAALGQTRPWLPDGLHLLFGLLLLATVITYAFMVSSLTEARTDDLRRWLIGHIPMLSGELLRPATRTAGQAR